MTIKKRIGISVATLLVAFTLTMLLLFFYIFKFKSALEENTNIARPSLLAITELNGYVVNTKNLTKSWQRAEMENHPDKILLKEIHKKKYPEFSKYLHELSRNWKSKKDKATLDTIFSDFEKVRAFQLDIMQSLNTFESYSDPMVALEMDDKIETMSKESKKLEDKISKLVNNQKKESVQKETELNRNMTLLIWILVVSGIVIVIALIWVSYWLILGVANPLVQIKDIVVRLGKGELVKSELKVSEDEIGEMVIAVDNLVEGLGKTSSFAENIGKGNYASEYTPLSDHDVLGYSLLTMRSNLQDVAEIEKQRKWATEGVAKFAEILRIDSDLDALCVEIIRNLVKYTNANQGGIFLLNDEGSDSYLQLMGCYAYERKKFQEKKVELGEGLVGQCWLEKDTILLTDVPEDYINITSGLGLANPTCILIVPLKINEEINGVIEIASFKVFKKYEIDFIEKIAESVASSLSSVRVNHRTAKLLTESRELAEQLRSQEEELRQNQEEMQATAEETERMLKEAQETIALLKQENLRLTVK